MHLLSTLRPTQNQLRVIATIAASKEFPARAAAEISNDENLVAARNLLMKLDVITFTDNSAELTDKGEQLAREQNIIDDSGQLTDEGNKLISTSTEKNGNSENNEPPTQEPELPITGGPGELSSLPGMEGFSPLFKHLING